MIASRPPGEFPPVVQMLKPNEPTFFDLWSFWAKTFGQILALRPSADTKRLKANFEELPESKLAAR